MITPTLIKKVRKTIQEDELEFLERFTEEIGRFTDTADG